MADQYLEINDVISHTPAWEPTTLAALLAPPPPKDRGNLAIDGANYRRALPQFFDEQVMTFPWRFRGKYDLDGDLVTDLDERDNQLVLNVEQFRQDIGLGQLVDVIWHRLDGETWTVQAQPWMASDGVKEAPDIYLTRVDLVIPVPVWTPTGS